MTDVLIIEPKDIVYNANYPTPSGYIYSGVGGANLFTNDPREIWLGPTNNSITYITIDLGSDVLIDTVFLGNVNASVGNIWSFQYGPSALGNVGPYFFYQIPLRLPSEDGFASRRGDCIYAAQAPVLARYLQITIQMTAEPNLALEIGRVVVGAAFRPFYNRETGATRVPFDSGSRERASDGTLNTVSGSLISGFKWVFGDLNDAEIKTLWGIFRRRRTTEPLVLIENNGDTITDASVHYGTFVELEGYQRQDARKNRLALTFQDWL